MPVLFMTCGKFSKVGVVVVSLELLSWVVELSVPRDFATVYRAELDAASSTSSLFI